MNVKRKKILLYKYIYKHTSNDYWTRFFGTIFFVSFKKDWKISQTHLLEKYEKKKRSYVGTIFIDHDDEKNIYEKKIEFIFAPLCRFLSVSSVRKKPFSPKAKER